MNSNEPQNRQDTVTSGSGQCPGCDSTGPIKEFGKPSHGDLGGAGRIVPQVVALPRSDHDSDLTGGGRHPERVLVAVDDERGARRIQLAGPTRLWLARRVQRERQRQHADRAELTRGSRGHPGTGRPAAQNERQARAGPALSLLDRRDPGRIKLPGRCRRATTKHAVRLSDPGHGDARGDRSITYRKEIGRVDPAGGAMAQREQTRGGLRQIEHNLGRSVRSVHRELAQAEVASSRAGRTTAATLGSGRA
jgi:hypothetical protein